MLILQFTPTSILQEFRSKILYGLGTSLCLLPAISFDADNIPDLNDVTLQDFNSGSHTSLIVNRHTEFYHKRLRDIVFEFHEMGFLDEIEWRHAKSMRSKL